jgi:hypothetical protein
VTLTDQEQVVLKAIRSRGRGVTEISAILRAVGYPKATTKKILASLADKGVVALHRHDYPVSLTPAERKLLIRRQDGRGQWHYFTAVSIRNPGGNLKGKRKTTRRKKNRTIIKRAKRVVVINRGKAAKKRAAKKARPARRRNKAARVTESDISKFPAHVQRQLRAQLGQVEKREEKATTPAQKRAAAKSRRSFLSRLGTRLRLIGRTKKIKVSARDLGRCPRKTVKVRARHETDALAKARAKLGGRFDQLRVQNSRRKARGSRKGIVRNSTPKVRALREKFTGMPSRSSATMNAPAGTPRNLAKLGRLVSIKAQRGTIKPSRRNPGSGTVWLCADAKGRLHLCTTGARLIEGPSRSFGEVREVEYEAVKPHLGHKRPTIFFHKLGEEGGRRPELIADGQGGLKFKGGDYTITAEGIRD